MLKKVLSLDISSKAGFALLQGECGTGALPEILEKGLILGTSPFQHGAYPQNYYLASFRQAEQLLKLTERTAPDEIVIEEVNLGKSRYSQRSLEWTHAFYVYGASTQFAGTPIIYISSSQWRSTVGLVMSKTDKKANALLSKAKKSAAESGAKLDKAALGVRGKVTKKHLAVRWVNERYGLDFRIKDNDVADAIALGVSHFWGAEACDGT